MCAACGSPSHVPDLAPPPAEPAPVGAPRRFAALRNRDCRPYLVGTGLAMMADNVEHVITYWVLWGSTPRRVGFQVISHWVPFLLLSVYFGGLADRFDCRRVIQTRHRAGTADLGAISCPVCPGVERPRRGWRHPA
jgi:hypothetical protein